MACRAMEEKPWMARAGGTPAERGFDSFQVPFRSRTCLAWGFGFREGLRRLRDMGELRAGK